MKPYLDPASFFNFSLKKSTFYGRFTHVDRYLPLMFKTPDMEMPKFIYLEKDLYFVIKHRDINFFRRVIDFQVALGYFHDSTELIIFIAEHVKDFKPYIDYLYEKDFPVVENAQKDLKWDLLSWLYLIRKKEVVDHLINEHNYPVSFFTQAQFTNHYTRAMIFDLKEDLLILKDRGFAFNALELVNKIPYMRKKRDCKNHTEMLEFLKDNHFLSDAKKEAIDFTFLSAYAEKECLSLHKMKAYHSRYLFNFSNLNLSEVINKNFYHEMGKCFHYMRNLNFLNSVNLNFKDIVMTLPEETLLFIRTALQDKKNDTYLRFLLNNNIPLLYSYEKDNIILLIEIMSSCHDTVFEQIMDNLSVHEEKHKFTFRDMIENKKYNEIQIFFEKKALTENTHTFDRAAPLSRI